MNIERITTMAGNGGPPGAAATLYPGKVMHARLKPFGHRFAYKVVALLIDLDRLDEANLLSPIFSVNRANLTSFHEADHTEQPGETTRAHADRLLAQAGLRERAGRILLLSFPRVFGYVFNPLSIYFAYEAQGRLVALIYSVRNTFGQRHSYVAPLLPGELSAAGVRQERSKLLHVSPFIGMDARYHFRILPPGETVRLRIHETEAGVPVLSATFCGEACSLDTRTLAASLLKIPFVTWKITIGIHWEALKLRLKGATFHRSPPAPGSASLHDEGARPEPGE